MTTKERKKFYEINGKFQMEAKQMEKEMGNYFILQKKIKWKNKYD